jgi:hypothetical protein
LAVQATAHPAARKDNDLHGPATRNSGRIAIKKVAFVWDFSVGFSRREIFPNPELRNAGCRSIDDVSGIVPQCLPKPRESGSNNMGALSASSCPTGSGLQQ